MRRWIVCSWVLLCSCQRLNPAFDQQDELAANESGTTGPVDSSEGSEAETTVSETEDTGPSESSESSTETETETETDTDVDPCLTGEALCDGICVELDVDPFNCGDCDVPCSDEQVCAAGTCVVPKRVFVTSIPFMPGEGGVEAAKEFCTLLASSAGMDGVFDAWLSTSNHSPAETFIHGSAYVRTDGVLIATSWADLIDGSHPNPIDVDEFGGPLPGVPGCGIGSGAWSATTSTGTFAGAPNCANWTIASINETGKLGDVLAMDAKWSDVGNCSVPCSTPLPIYCFEQ